jgi:glycosyltransferase involved in cell wall biosynthesis
VPEAKGLVLNSNFSCVETSPRVEVLFPKIEILMCTFEAGRFLNDQLDSIIAQTHQNWQLLVSDDASKDGTRKTLESYQNRLGPQRLKILSGPSKGFVSNFLSLTCNSSSDSNYYAYSDQDDIWDDDKLERALKWLHTIPDKTPALYCSRTRLVDSNNNEIGLSPLFSKPPSFANALMQNIGGGNTMVFNHAARTLLLEAGENISVVSHDWWVYLLVTGCGGKVFYDSIPSVRYRQHSKNLVGMNGSWNARIKRIRMLWQGRFQRWIDDNIVALQKIHHQLTPANQTTLALFTKARTMSFIFRLIYLKKSGIYRQTLLGNLGLIAAAVFNKI